MRLLERNPRLSGLMVGLAVLALAGVRAQALEISSTRPGSIAVFPKVIADGTRDTIISMTNTSNMMAYVHCVATNGLGTCINSPDPANQVYYCNDDLDCLDVEDPSGSTVPNVGPCDVFWQPVDYEFALTAQQPTFWRLSTGRVQDPALASGTSCTGDPQICPGFFLARGDAAVAGANVPGAFPFRGEIRCFQTDAFGALIPANSIKGEAFIEGLEQPGPTAPAVGTGRLSGYNSINFEGGVASGDGVANLDDVEYARCPAGLTFDTLAPGLTDPISAADVEVELTFVPCTFDEQNPTSFRTQLFTYDEQEGENSGGDVRTCWANYTGSRTGGLQGRSTTFLRTTAAATHTGNCTAGGPPTAPCTSDSDCGRLGTCFDNSCVAGSSIGRVCGDAGDCGAGGVCGPPSSIIGVVETVYDNGGTSGSDINVMHQTGVGSTDDAMDIQF